MRSCLVITIALGWALFVAPTAAGRDGEDRDGEDREREQATSPQPGDQVDRSPVDVVVAPDDSWLVTANQTSHTVSLVRTADGQVLHELPVGRRPSALALCPDAVHVLVSASDAGDVVLLKVHDGRLEPVATIHTGYHPLGIAVTPDGRRAYVALTAADRVAAIDLDKRRISGHIEVGRWPRYLALSPDASRLAVGTSGDRGVSVVDTAVGKMLYLEKFSGLNIGHLQVSADGQHAYFPWMIYRKNAISADNIRRGWVLASRIARVRLDGSARREALSLDPRGKAVADPHGLALTRDNQSMVVSASGTRELLVFRVPGLPLQDYGGGDHIDPRLLNDRERFDRVPLGGRPMGVRIGSDDQTVYVANYLDNSVQVVDLKQRKLVRRIAVGGADEPSLARRGAAIFYDGTRSLDQWYSCHTCHYDGGTSSERMDTLNDGTTLTFKSVLPLYGLPETGPWTWHGWQQDLTAAMHKSLTSTMLGKEPNDEDVSALLAFLGELAPPVNPHRNRDGSLSAAAERGKLVFHGERAACASCHVGPHYTDGEIHDVGLGGPSDRYKGFNTPSLRAVYSKVHLLHDGRAQSLEQLLTEYHSPEKVSGSGPLSPQELSDLIEYLKSL